MKIPPRITLTNSMRILCVFTLLLSSAATILLKQDAYAVTPVGSRSLTLEPGTNYGGSTPSLPVGGPSSTSYEVTHEFKFTLTNAETLGSITLQYCDKAGTTAAFPNCTEPADVDTQYATTVTNVSGPVFNATAVPGTTDPTVGANKNAITINRTASGTAAGAVVDVKFASVVNPSTPNKTFFVWINTWSGANGTGTNNDSGVVNASTASPIQLQGQMPESLIFCTGDQIPATGGGTPDCPNAHENVVKFNKLFDPADTASATSQMAASTNAGSGYAITVTGATLQNGGNSITAIGHTATDSTHNSSQFGMNLVNNTPRGGVHTDDVAAVGAAPAPLAGASGGTYRGDAVAPYSTNEQWAYLSGDEVASSDNPSLGPSDIQLFTASYIVNVTGSQPAGTYTTTLTYVCTPTF